MWLSSWLVLFVQVSEGDREPPPGSDPELEGMAGALVRALAARSNAIQQSGTPCTLSCLS